MTKRRNNTDDGSRYDTEDRSAYMAKYYEDRREVLSKRSKMRYRNNRDELSRIAREKYTPKTQRHSIYR